MTAPDYEAKAHELWLSLDGYWAHSIPLIAAALREADAAGWADGRDAAARAAEVYCPLNASVSALVLAREIAAHIRALAPPAPGGKPDAPALAHPVPAPPPTSAVDLLGLLRSGPVEMYCPDCEWSPRRSASRSVGCETCAPVWAALTALASPASPPDDPQWDGTDAAHPAWWRGERAGSLGVVTAVNEWLDGRRLTGTYSLPQLQCLRERIRALASPAAEKRAEPEGAPLTSGQRAQVSIQEHRRRLKALFDENEARPLPDTALRGALLDADRVADELCDAMKHAAPTPKADPREERIAELERILEWYQTTDFAVAQRTAEKLLRECEEALRPFAEHAQKLAGWRDDAGCGWFPKVSQVRRAATLLAKLAARAGRG